MAAADISRRQTRKWPGLGGNPFKIDYARMFEQYRPQSASGESTPP